MPKKDVVLFDHTGQEIDTKSVPDLDPNFMKSWWTLFGGSSGNVSAITRQPYAKHPWVYAAVSAIVNNISRLPVIVGNKNNPEEFSRDNELIALFRNPNNLMNGSEFFEAVLLNLMLPTTVSPGGQCFILPLDKNGEQMSLISGKLPSYLFPFSDESIEPVKGDKAEQTSVRWKYKHPSGEELIFYPDQLIRVRLFNPYNWLLGLSPYSSIAITATADAKASELSDKFMDNSANVGGILKTDSKLTTNQAEGIKNMWADQYEGWSKAGKTAFLHSGLKFEQTAKNLQELQFTDQRQMNRDTILAVYGVPKTVLGLTDTVNRATAKVEKEIFWEDTLMPLIDKLWLGLNNQFIRHLGNKNIVGQFDLSNVQPLKKDVSQKIKDAKLLIEQGLPADEAYRTVNLPVNNLNMYPWLSQPLVVKPRVNLNTGEVIGAVNQGNSEAEKAYMKYLSSEPEAVKLLEEKASTTWLDHVTNVLKKPEKKFNEEFKKYLIRQRNKILDRVDSWAANKSKAQPEGVRISAFISGKLNEDKILMEMAAPIYDETIGLQTLQAEKDLGQLLNYKPSPKVTSAIRKERIEFLKGVNTTNFKTLGNKLTGTIETGLRQNLTTQQLAKEIKNTTKDFYNFRIKNSMTIARTETSAVAQATKGKIFKAEKIEKWRWVTAADEKVRHTHALEGDGPGVKVGDPFPVTGLIQPLDSNGAPSEVINCRCTTEAVK